jgi:hypothetical protein
VVQVQARARPDANAERASRRRGAPGAPVGGSRHGAVLELQRAAGNRAVASVLNAPVVQRDNGGDGETDETKYRKLLTDAATAAGLGSLAGFDPGQINRAELDKDDNKGTAKPGLNLSLNRGSKAGHTGWVDDAGKYPVNLDLKHAEGVPKVGITMIITAGALLGDQSLAIATIRHEMVHVRHHLMTLDVLKKWDGKGGRRGFDKFLNNNQKRLHLSGLDRALIDEQADDLVSNTEVLGYVEGFMSQFNAKEPTDLAFFELLGAVRSKYENWAGAKPEVKDEAISRLRAFYATLDEKHQKRWKDWVNGDRAKHRDDASRMKFYDRLDFLK